VGEEIVSFAGSPPDVALNVYVLAAFAGTTHKREISRAIVKQNGLRLITHQIINGPANPAKLKQFQMQNVEVSPAMYGAQILRNISRDIRNMKAMLSCSALKCIAKSVKCSNMEMKYLGIGSFAEVISHVTTKKAKDMYRFTIDHLGEEMATIVDALLHILTSGEVENSEVDDELTDIPGADVTTELKNDEKLVKIACNLLYIIARDNEDAKRLIAQSGLLATLCENCIDYLESGVSIGETLLSLLKLIACNPSTQTAFVEDGLSKLVRYLVEADRPETHNHATCVFHSLANNPASHPTVVKNGLLPLLLVLRNSKDLDSRRVSLESLLNFVENPSIHNLIRDEYDLVQTIVAISKFGINKNVKERAADAILVLMGDGKLPTHLKKLKLERSQKETRSPKRAIPPLSLPQKRDEGDRIPTKERKPSKEKKKSASTKPESRRRPNIPKIPLRKDFPAAPSTPDVDSPAVPSTPDVDSSAVSSVADIKTKAPPITMDQTTTLPKSQTQPDQPLTMPLAQPLAAPVQEDVVVKKEIESSDPKADIHEGAVEAAEVVAMDEIFPETPLDKNEVVGVTSQQTIEAQEKVEDAQEKIEDAQEKVEEVQERIEEAQKKIEEAQEKIEEGIVNTGKKVDVSENIQVQEKTLEKLAVPEIIEEIEDKQSTTQTQEKLIQPVETEIELNQTQDLEDKTIVEKSKIRTEP